MNPIEVKVIVSYYDKDGVIVGKNELTSEESYGLPDAGNDPSVALDYRTDYKIGQLTKRRERRDAAVIGTLGDLDKLSMLYGRLNYNEERQPGVSTHVHPEALVDMFRPPDNGEDLLEVLPVTPPHHMKCLRDELVERDAYHGTLGRNYLTFFPFVRVNPYDCFLPGMISIPSASDSRRSMKPESDCCACSIS